MADLSPCTGIEDLAQYGGAQNLLEDYLLTFNVCPEDQDSEYWGATCPG